MVGFWRFEVAFFSSRFMRHFIPSAVFSIDFSSSAVAGSSPIHFAQSAGSRTAGIRSVGSAVISLLAGTVTITQAYSGRGAPTSNLR